MADSTPLTTNISPEQYRWLKARLGVNSDAAACSECGFTKDQVRHWKRSPAFRTLLGLVRTSPRQALQALAFVLAGGMQLEAIERLLKSHKGSDVKAGLDALDRLKKGLEEQEDVAGFQQIINVLNVRGSLPDGVQQYLPQMRRVNGPGTLIDGIGSVVGDERGA